MEGKTIIFPLLEQELFWFDAKWLASVNIPERNNIVSLTNYCIIEDDWIKTLCLWLFNLFNGRCTVSPINPSFLPIYCIVVHRGVSIAIRLAWLIKWEIKNKSNFDYRHDAVSNKWGWRVGTLYPLLPSTSQYQTQNRQKRTPDQEKFSRSTFKFDFNLWMSKY